MNPFPRAETHTFHGARCCSPVACPNLSLSLTQSRGSRGRCSMKDVRISLQNLGYQQGNHGTGSKSDLMTLTIPWAIGRDESHGFQLQSHFADGWPSPTAPEPRLTGNSSLSHPPIMLLLLLNQKSFPILLPGEYLPYDALPWPPSHLQHVAVL